LVFSGKHEFPEPWYLLFIIYYFPSHLYIPFILFMLF
jgi:hypothetical protein